MKFITYEQYRNNYRNAYFTRIEDIGIDYKLEKNDKNYDEKEIKEIDKKHDKMFRNILSGRTEMAKFLNDFLPLKEKIKETEIIQCHTDLITSRYKDRYSDIIYKLKEKPVYFLLEHQSTIDRNMPLRIWEYIGEIMRREDRIQKVYPVVIPIIIYTGVRRWKLETNLKNMQYQARNYQNYQIDLEYNLIAVQDYSFEELLAKNTVFSSIMIMEKCKNKEELILQMDTIIEKMEDIKDLEAIKEILIHIISSYIGEEKTKQLLRKIEEKEVTGMSPLTKMFLDLKYENRKEGEKQGIILGIKSIAKNMLKSKEPDEKIIKYTGITKEELEELKGEVIYS